MGSIAPTKPSILFVTANLPTPEDEAAIWIGKIEAYLSDPLCALRARGAAVHLRTFQDPGLTAEAIASTYTHVLFLAADKYIHHMRAFTTLLAATLPAAQRLNPTLRIHNPPALAAWNANKTYLAELQDSTTARSTTFHVPRTSFLDPRTTSAAALAAHLAADPHVAASPSTPVVLKPSIAASGHSTHLIRAPLALVAADVAALEAMRAAAQPGAMVLVQEYLPRVAARDGDGGSGGEWSMVVVAGRLTHAVRKRPRAGEFRINSAFEGVWEPMGAEGDERVPECGKRVAGEVWEWLVGKERALKAERGEEGVLGREELLYARVDGVVGEDGEFVLMEVELIEPWLWLLDREGHPGREGLRVFVDALVGEEGGGLK
ncbi:glutathione synthetase [Diplodia corticola]|uniref:Glutathione synthetase n=1 Tax=Diplodia corticola TaxID=236234 RepID=A0A1J9S5Q8_9PEZI|nr:glutathione synthetase [Diplodia corticola]OJD40291.1 glutathione synthetase [Diplodia corticola]